MSYIRTKEIKEKQSKKMKEKVKEYDWLSIIEKRNNTIKENNIKVGRKKGDGPAKRGTEKPCCFCKKLFYVTQKNLNKRKYCSRECMHSDPEYKLNKHYLSMGNISSNFFEKEFIDKFLKSRFKTRDQILS